ncbi:MAG: hypothetical protein ACI9LV_000470 [Candidatus Nanohaloarchaea archaeon]|jgi:hypothetical protein
MELKISRKGFYFSFDAFLAFTVMAASLAVVSQSSFISSSSFDASTVDYREANVAGKDAMKLASSQKFSSFNKSFQNELVERTVMDEQDMNRTLVDGVTLLWAARNFSYAKEVSRKYFDQKVPEGYGYRIQVDSQQNTSIIHSTSSIPADSSSVTSISRLVSGHEIDRPSEGFQSRATLTSFSKNETRSYTFASQGGAMDGGLLTVERNFELDADRINSARLYLALDFGCEDNDLADVRVNGDSYSYSDVDWERFDDGCNFRRGGFGSLDVTESVQPGRNNVTIEFRASEYHAHIQPGTRLTVNYTDSGLEYRSEPVHRRIYFENTSARVGSSDQTGLFSMKSYEIPQGAEIINASFKLNASGVERENYGQCYYGGFYCTDEYDVRVYHDGEKLLEKGAPEDGSVEQYFDITEETHQGTNLVSTYLDFQNDGGWSNTPINLHSDYRTNKSTHIDVWYRPPEDQVRFGTIQVRRESFFDETANRITMSPDFEYNDITQAHAYPVQLSGSRIDVRAWPEGDPSQNVFSSERSREIPSSVFIDPIRFDTESENYVEMQDENPDNVFYRKSSLSYTARVPNQVGYGQLFDSRQEAADDARERLEDTIGPHVEQESIRQETLSTGNQPYLWGPASVELVIWDE